MKVQKRWIIRSRTQTDSETSQPLYWNNAQGWVDRDSASRFSSADHWKLNLPLGGEWELAIWTLGE